MRRASHGRRVLDAKNGSERAKNSLMAVANGMQWERNVDMPRSTFSRSGELDPRAGAALGGLVAVVLPAALVPLRGDISPAALALVLVLPVLLGAVTGGRLGGAVSAVVATLGFDFFLTRPYLRLTIDSQDDVETAVLFLLVALIVGTVAAGAQRSSAKAHEGRAELEAIYRVAETASGGSRITDVIDAARRELVRVLQLDACEFDGSARPSSLPVLEHNGTFDTGRFHNVRGGFTLPSGIELHVRNGDRALGRFVLHGRPGVPVSIDARLAAVVIADQVGAAIAANDDSEREEQA
jgi:hypothetical protein